MFLSSEIFSPFWNGFFALLMLLPLSLALLKAQWHLMRGVAIRQHLFYACVISLVLLWHLQIKWFSGFALHPLGMTAVTLILGWQFAFIAGVSAQLLCVLTGVASLETLAINTLLTVFIPCVITTCLLIASNKLRYQNLFIYLLGVGFIGASLVVVALALSFVALAYVFDLFSVLSVVEQAPMLLLLMFPEGFINGMLITAVAVFKPDWVKTFDDDFYIDGKA